MSVIWPIEMDFRNRDTIKTYGHVCSSYDPSVQLAPSCINLVSFSFFFLIFDIYFVYLISCCFKQCCNKQLCMYIFGYISDYFFFFNERVVDLQGCANFCCTAKLPSHMHIHSFSYIIFHHGLSQEIGYSSLC